ncbi:group II intron reverse transcriptase/maturase, partial [Robinsoniella peoriensis]|uniref:group II intron reverse transcriptase/maturase n=1 Tax=Robinsoniella peoriensis TaxID=180332 RepID=UPI00085C24AF
MTQNNLYDQKALKDQSLRNNEYYTTQDIFDKLYQDSKNGKIFNNLMSLIISTENLTLAFRNIKGNKGSKTAGINKHTIDKWSNESVDIYISYMRNRFENYIAMPVRRVEIPKPNGKKRPLGIPTIEDRLIQQSIKQVLEPICEAKFYDHSYGFRPNRSTEHAISYFSSKINLVKCRYIVDVDIKGFFDNVNHGKLLKQIWAMGIRDKQLISIISKMLKAPISDKGILTPNNKGTPQGGILSPLLSNIVLNELDWWIATQWVDMKSRNNPFNLGLDKHGRIINSNKYSRLRQKSKLKEIYIVRYADDFKIICRTKTDATRIFIATQQWLKERLKLDISPEKSGITDIRRSTTEFLGFSLKAHLKRQKYVLQSHICNKAKTKIQQTISDAIIKMQKHPNLNTVGRYNSIILGIQNYYRIATQVSRDLGDIAYILSKKLKVRLKAIKKDKGSLSNFYKSRYKNNYKVIFVAQIALFPLADIQTK